jgi:hypothetical protein
MTVEVPKHDTDVDRANQAIAQKNIEASALWVETSGKVVGDAQTLYERAKRIYDAGDSYESLGVSKTGKELRIRRKDGFINVLKSYFGHLWLGDERILEALIYIAASYKVENADDGIHLGILGNTQVGKSESIKTGLTLIPHVNQTSMTFSLKWIFYAQQSGDIHENMILFSDDTQMKTEVAALLRGILSSWHTGVKHGTVNVDRNSQTLTVPRHINLILTNTDAITELSDLGQDESRFMLMEIRRTPEQERAIREFIQRQRPDFLHDMRKFAEAIWSCVPTKTITMHKTIEKDIPIREFKRYLTMIRCHALLCNRDLTNDEDVLAIDEFLTYTKPMIDSTTPAHSRDEQAVLSVLRPDMEMVISDIQTQTRMSRGKVSRALHGGGTFDNPKGGLLMNSKKVRMEYYLESREHKFILI